MNVVIINQYATDGQESGGSRHMDLSRRLVLNGHEVVIVAGRTELNGLPRERDGVKFTWLLVRNYVGNGLARFMSMMRFGWDAAHTPLPIRPHVVIGSSVHPFAALAGWMQARRYRVPFLFEVRDLWPETLIQLGGYSRRHPGIILLSLLERFLYKKASAIIVLLPLAHKYICALGVPRKKIHYIPNGVDLERYNTSGALGSPSIERPLRVLYAGAHGIANNLDCLIDAAVVLAKRRVPVEFLLVGDGPEKENLMAKVDHLGLGSVTFQPLVPKSAVPDLLAGADAFCITAKATSLYNYGMSPNKLFDYLAAGKPIVFSGNVEPDLVKEAGAGLSVPGDDPAALADAVERLVATSVEERRRMGQSGREYVERHHSVRVLAQRLEEVLEQVVPLAPGY